jgi:hypothetical protein
MAQKEYERIELRKVRGGRFNEVAGKVRFGGFRFVVVERNKPVFRMEPVTGREVIRKRRSA